MSDDNFAPVAGGGIVVNKLPRRRPLTERLRKRGFDRTEYDRSTRSTRPRCSQCEVLVINGVACHETGCPNSK